MVIISTIHVARRDAEAVAISATKFAVFGEANKNHINSGYFLTSKEWVVANARQVCILKVYEPHQTQWMGKSRFDTVGAFFEGNIYLVYSTSSVIGKSCSDLSKATVTKIEMIQVFKESKKSERIE